MRVRFTGRHDLDGASRPPYDRLNLSHGVGDDPVALAHNRAALAAAVGVAARSLVWLDQVHGTRVAVLDDAPAGPVPGADAAVTARPGLALGVLTADCVPVLLDGEAAVGAVHAGRRGVAAGVVAAAVEAVRRFGAPRVRAHVGPCIGPCCYEVGPEVYDEVVAAEPAAAARTRTGRPALDLRAAVAAQLAALDVELVADVDRCTACDPAYFSYRRDGRTGRQAGVIVR